MTKVGTFAIRGSKQKGYWLEDTDTFNDWGIKQDSHGSNFETREAAEDYAQRCHDFKTGRRMNV